MSISSSDRIDTMRSIRLVGSTDISGFDIPDFLSIFDDLESSTHAHESHDIISGRGEIQVEDMIIGNSFTFSHLHDGLT